MEFAYLYRGRGDNDAASPEERQRHLQQWVAWFKELGVSGHLKDTGHPLEGTGRVVRGVNRLVTDGPFAEAKDVVGGFTLIEAASLAEAAEISKGCPILEVGGSVEIRPIQKLSM